MSVILKKSERNPAKYNCKERTLHNMYTQAGHTYWESAASSAI